MKVLKAILGIAALFGAASVSYAQARGEQVPKTFEKQITKTLKAGYLLYLPKEYGQDRDKKFPLILFLHGAGESGTDIEKVKVHGPPKLAAQGKEIPFIIVSPQSPGGGWNNEVLINLLDEIERTYNVDTDREYLTGLSMGGFGTWALATEYPNRFAAIAPICGGGQAFRARRIKDVPVWVFHGAKDPVVPVKSSQDMVDALKAAGAAEVKFTIYPEAMHDSWTETYSNKELYEWFLAHKRKASP